ncbi:MAG: bifunctional 4-hydroxy-2-oxoglutarate aldolase/2-dehydro-3-deoxy-phosphogluconate aldolase [Pseudomonadota bacterium]
MMDEILKKVEGYGIVPVVRIEKAADAIPLGKALLAGGLPLAEITFRTAAAEEVIRTLTEGMPKLIVGAGTVLTTEQAGKAIRAGASFIVSPGFNPKIVSFCREQGVLVIPGVNSPTQIEAAMECGVRVMKFFPAEESGGVAFLKAVAAPYEGIRFIPTGGINAANLISYLSLKNVIACGGSWMVKGELISAGKFEEITRLTAEAVRILLGFVLAYVGINEENAENASKSAELFSRRFHIPAAEGQGSFFLGEKEIEILKGPGRGEKGSLAFAANDIRRALFYLGWQGIRPVAGSERKKDGKTIFVYLDQEIAGFAIHLRQKG